MEVTIEKVNELIEKEYERLKNLSLSKNIQYNNSLQNPQRKISNASVTEGILNRIDDKLNRISSCGINEDTIDSVDDIIGYFMHIRIRYNIEKEIEKNNKKVNYIDIRGYHGC
jgi:Zn-dependent M32 family carboxypeptidase